MCDTGNNLKVVATSIQLVCTNKIAIRMVGRTSSQFLHYGPSGIEKLTHRPSVCILSSRSFVSSVDQIDRSVGRPSKHLRRNTRLFSSTERHPLPPDLHALLNPANLKRSASALSSETCASRLCPCGSVVSAWSWTEAADQ
jgi:hypothetical protein